MSATFSSEAVCPLLEQPEGSILHVDALDGPLAERSKLYAIGILPGTPLEVCSRCGKTGSVCVRVRHSSVVLGEGMARCIMCRKAKPACVQ